MDRRDFLQICALLGISIPVKANPLMGETNPSSETGKVLIVGAGAAGMAAGFLLEQKGIDYQILEASQSIGGRMKRTDEFVDFPIPLGAEWLHVSVDELAEFTSGIDTDIETELKGYSEEDQIGYYEDGELSHYSIYEAFGNSFNDQKFINSTWFDFFNEYIGPDIRSRIRLNTPVKSIEYSGRGVTATDSNGASYNADKIIVTVPLKVLQKEAITFDPGLSSPKKTAIGNAPICGGIKVFLKFQRNFIQPTSHSLIVNPK